MFSANLFFNNVLASIDGFLDGFYMCGRYIESDTKLVITWHLVEYRSFCDCMIYPYGSKSIVIYNLFFMKFRFKWIRCLRLRYWHTGI